METGWVVLRDKLVFICKLEFCRDFFQVLLVFLSGVSTINS